MSTFHVKSANTQTELFNVWSKWQRVESQESHLKSHGHQGKENTNDFLPQIIKDLKGIKWLEQVTDSNQKKGKHLLTQHLVKM